MKKLVVQRARGVLAAKELDAADKMQTKAMAAQLVHPRWMQAKRGNLADSGVPTWGRGLANVG